MGVQAARAQLRSNAEPEHYDGDRAEKAEWAYVAPAARAKRRARRCPSMTA